MKIDRTPFRDLLIIHPQIHGDDRGYFMESFNEARFRVETGLNVTFVQDNESQSKKGVLRGLHFQAPPKSQGKLVRVIKGAVLDVVLDLRKSEPTYGQHFKLVLSAQNKTQLYVPEGFAHGFAVLEDDSLFSYKCTNYYSPEHDRGVRWNDPALNIDWEIENPVLSEKDKSLPLLSTLDNPFF
jgi:dTDP-4-dehydrorhamnose 3,5-epimerase